MGFLRNVYGEPVVCARNARRPSTPRRVFHYSSWRSWHRWHSWR